MEPGCSVASLSLSLINQVTGQEGGQEVLKARHADRERVEAELRSFASQARALPTARLEAARLPKVFPSQTSFFQLLLPRDLGVEGACMHYV